MSPIPHALVSQVKIRLRRDRFNTITAILGCESTADRARLLGVNYKTISRVRSGIIGEEFIAHAMAMLRRHEEALAEFGITTAFEELFELVDDDQAVG